MTKTKSRHHKSENSYKFQTLSERLSNINVDVAKRINRYNTKPEETESYFYQSLEKWVDLNYSATFYEFTIKVKRNCQTLALIVYNKSMIIEILKEYISKSDPLSLQPILDLTVQLSRDLQNDFYEYFPTIFDSIIKLLDTQNTDILEWSFQTLSFLFKFLWRYMLKDLKNVYNLYSPLLNENRKEYIRNFAAESFAFLMRKVIDKNELIDFLLQRLKEHPDESMGIGRLVFEMFRGVKHQFNACTEQVFKILLNKLNCFEDKESNQLVFQCIGKSVQSMAEYTNKQHSSLVWKCFYAKINDFLSEPFKLFYLLGLIKIFLEQKNCYLIDDLDLLIQNLSKIADTDFKSIADLEIDLTERFMNVNEIILKSSNVIFSIEKANILPSKLYQSKYNCDCIYKLTRSLFDFSLFETTIVPNLINYFETNIDKYDKIEKNYEEAFINLVSEYLVIKKEIIQSNSCVNFKKIYETNKTNNTQNDFSFYEFFAEEKNLNHLIRLFSDKKFKNSKLYTKLSQKYVTSVLNNLTNKLNKNNFNSNQDFEIAARVILTSPILFNNNQDIFKQEYNLFKGLIDRLNNDITNSNYENMELRSFILSINIWSLLLSKISINNFNNSDLKNLLNLFFKHEQLIKSDNKILSLEKSFNHLLRAISLYVVGLNVDEKNISYIQDTLKDKINLFKNQLSSPYHENRLNTLNTLDIYYKTFKTNKKNASENDTTPTTYNNLVEICIKAEETPASLDEYRQKIYYLQLLEPSACSKYLEEGENNNQNIPLLYFFGVLFENFKLIWEPVIELIQSYTTQMKMNDFWAIFGDYFNHLSDKILSLNELYSETNEKELPETSILNYLSTICFNDDLNIDYLNNRLLLCKAMQGFASSCESKTRVLVPLFFKFINNEYYKEENRLLSTAYEDLTVKRYDRNLNKKSAKEKYFNKSLLNKHLCAYLEIFAKFTSPKSWYQEEKLRDLYFNLLCHHDSSVQKAALNCLYTYNYSYVSPYKEHLDKLIVGKHFRHELVVFSLDENQGKIHMDHRPNLLPILMRLLYGKFNSNETTHTSSRDTKANKRTIVIQFLSSCSEEELNYFFSLLFECLNTFVNQNNESLPDLLLKINDRSNKETSIYNLKRVIPLKKILGILQSLEIIIKKLARRMENYSHNILKFICFIHKYAHVLNEMANEFNKIENNLIEEHHLNLFKVIRQQVTLRFKLFFDTFDHISFNQIEYFFLFDSFLWPQSIRIPTECIKSVNNLMKIFLLWSEHSNYYPLFVVKLDNFNSLDKTTMSKLIQYGQTSQIKKSINLLDYFENKNILDIMFELIDSPKCSQPVIDHVLDIVHNLVSFADLEKKENDNSEELAPKVMPFDVDFIRKEFEQFNDLNFGTMILKPYVSSIVNHIEKIVAANMSKKNLPPRPLKILARLSCFATSSRQQCEKIIQLLIPYLIKNRQQTEENEINILNSINHLIKQVENVEIFIVPLARLFAVIKSRQSRVELTNIFDTIKKIDSSFEFMSQIVCDLNSWDPKRLEEPDYMLRLDAFNKLNSVVKEWNQFDIKLGSILTYNCSFFLNNIEDLAIKESSTNCLKIFLNKSSDLELSKSDKNFLETSFVAEIKNGLRNKKESARHEFISVLVEYIKSFADKFKFVNDLTVLFDKEDIEKDFYENIKHIQMHRRARALKKLQKACNDNLISSENLLGFMMPIVRSFLDNEMYHKYDYLIEDACISIGCICYVLAWPKYLKVVEYYLKILPKNIMNQKLIIKILVNVLDAFHFDLSLSTQNDYFSDDNKMKIEEVDDENDKMEVDGNLENRQEQEQIITVNNMVMIRKKKLVGSAMANKIHSTITKSILPMLFKCLTKRLKTDEQHKMNKREDEDEQILRVPMALAILKLLINLPSKTLDTHLPGLLFKVCDMLKSRAVSVRNTTRDCLMKMIYALPSKKYYFYVFKELSNCLTRGYQVHVLCFTIQMILKNVQDKLVVGDLDSSLHILMNSVNLELFSQVSEEKEVKQILSKVMEAKTNSSFNTLEFIAKFISQTHLLELLKPFKEQLDICNSRKLLKKIEEALRRILLGLLNNTSLTTENLMYLIYGLINDTFTQLTNTSTKQIGKRKKIDNKENENESKNILEYSCLLLPIEPKRGGDKPKVQSRTNQHVVVEFALQLMHNLIKQNKINQSDTKYSKMLDPYLPIFVEYLNGKYLKVTIITLRCLANLLKFQLPSLKHHSKQIATKLFNLLRTYSGASTSSSSDDIRGDNFELLMICYKVISSLIRDCDNFNLDEEQLQVLMHYAERNLYDNYKQASAFNLIKAVLHRKLECDELNEVLAKVMKLSIQADSQNVRLQSRQTILQYVLDYSLNEKKLMKILEFYIVQLDYEYENGRESSLEMIATMFNTFPLSKLNENATVFFLPLAIQLHNDESAKCKKLSWHALKSLIEKISIEKRDSLFEIVTFLFNDHEKPLHKRIAALLAKIFIEVETNQFERRLDKFLTILLKEIDADNFNEKLETNTNSLINEKFYDQYLINMLSLLIKLLSECKSLFRNTKYTSMMNQLFDQIKIYLTHEHSWVRLNSSQLFGLLFANNTIDELINDKKSYFYYSTESVFLKIRDLIDSFCVQLKSPILDNGLAEQVVKNLAYMSKIVNRNEYNHDENSTDSLINHDINIEWLIKKVIKEAKYELVNKPNETIKRTFIFKWLAALAMELDKEKLKNHLKYMIPVLQREIVIGQTNENLKKLAQEVLEFIKQTIGVEDFSLIYSLSNKKRVENVEKRKRKEAQIAILDPQLAATKKIRKMQRKKEAKKRKLVQKNPVKLMKLKKAKLSNGEEDF